MNLEFGLKIMKLGGEIEGDWLIIHNNFMIR